MKYRMTLVKKDKSVVEKDIHEFAFANGVFMAKSEPIMDELKNKPLGLFKEFFCVPITEVSQFHAVAEEEAIIVPKRNMAG